MDQHEQRHEDYQDDTQSEQVRGQMSQSKEQQSLARWLLEVMHAPELRVRPSSSEAGSTDEQVELTLRGDYHPQFYQQIPDFAFALLNDDHQATSHFAPLLFHLIGCRACHQCFLEVYDAMNVALHPRGPRPVLGQGTRTLEAMPQRLLAHLCQAWISQAEAVLRQARRDNTNQDALARLLLQQAIRISAHIMQSTVRRQALRDLVRVATLFDEDQSMTREQPAHAYTPLLVSGHNIVRRAESPLHPKETALEHVPLVLQSNALQGTITQQGQTLVLSLHDLDASLRGSPVVVSILLGSLLEPIRWAGGNPLAIRSTTPVDEYGTLTLTLGETELRLSNPEERNMLEATFLLVEVRRVNTM